MKVRWIIAAALVGVMVIAFLMIRQEKSNELVSLIAMRPEQPYHLDTLAFDHITISLDDRTLTANYLSAGNTAPAFFISMGNGETLYEWMNAQHYLQMHGYSSFVFTYTGFGNSTGEPTATSLYEDLEAAYGRFVELTPQAIKRYALSHSLGGTPLIGRAAELDPHPDKIIVHAAFSSILTLMADHEMADPDWMWLYPDMWNNLKDAPDLDMPVLYLHSRADSTVPFYHSELLQKTSGELSKLVLLDGFGHNDIYQKVSDSLYRPVLEFVRE